MIETIEFKGEVYPKFQSEGNAAQFALPFAKHFCKGELGVDVGCNRLDWKFPNAIPVDPALNEFDALNFPIVNNQLTGGSHFDWVHSSHCLEHLNDWVGVLDYWLSQVRMGGVIFLYLPHYSQKYWRVHNNRKHVNNLKAEEIVEFFKDRGCAKVFSSGVDLNNSFYVVCEK